MRSGGAEHEKELKRIKEVYARRAETASPHLYSYLNPANLFIVQSRERRLLKNLRELGITSLSDKMILDVGCGSGGELRNLVRYGAQPEKCYGLDLLEERIKEAKRISPNMNLQCGDAAELPYNKESFDIVMQFCVFTSVLDAGVRRKIATEMLRVLKQDGLILWYDFFVDNPQNPDVRGVPKKEIHALFVNCHIHLDRITLAPPLTRRIAPYSWGICYVLEKFKILNTHYIGVIRKSDR